MIRPEPGAIDPYQLYPGLENSIDDKVAYAESRIRNWVLMGVLANLLTLAGITIPCVFYIGRVAEQATTAFAAIQDTQSELQKRKDWMRDREIWEMGAESWMVQEGYKPHSFTRSKAYE